MHKPTIPSLAVAVLMPAALFLGACSETVPETRVVDSKGTEAIVTSGINPQDWANAADQMVNSLLSSGVLERVPRQPAVMAIDRITNNTQLSVDTDLLVKKIRVALNRSGKVETTSTMGIGERAVVASEAAELEELTTGKKTQMKAPDFTLLGKLIQTTQRAGNITQNTYTFQMSLVSVKSGNAIWEDEREIAKQSKRPSVGW